MSLIEVLEQYRYYLKFKNQTVADQFLDDSVDPALHQHIRSTFNSNNDLSRADGSTFYWQK